RQAGHLSENADEVTTLQWQELLESLFASAQAIGKNHLAHRRQSLIAKEHMLSTTKPDALGAKLSCCLSVEWSIGVGAHSQPSKLVGPTHQLIEVIIERRLNSRHLSQKHTAS